MTPPLEEVLADARSEAQVLRSHGHKIQADTLERFVQRVAESMEDYLTKLTDDQAELLAWQEQTSAKRTFLVHGEEDVMKQFAAHLANTHIEMPGSDQVFEL